MNGGDFVYINYVGRVKDTGEIFDLTIEDVAKKENLFKSDFNYGPVPVVVDANFVLPGLNDALKEMKVGEKRTVKIPVEKAFGQRSAELVKLIPESALKSQNIDATPGTFVTINRIKGRIISNDGGRVKIDFNHPLAGKTLEYEMEVFSEIKDTVEKVKAMAYFFTGLGKDKIDAGVEDKDAEITINEKVDVPRDVKGNIADSIIKWVQGIERVKFVEIFEK